MNAVVQLSWSLPRTAWMGSLAAHIIGFILVMLVPFLSPAPPVTYEPIAVEFIAPAPAVNPSVTAAAPRPATRGTPAKQVGFKNLLRQAKRLSSQPMRSPPSITTSDSSWVAQARNKNSQRLERESTPFQARNELKSLMNRLNQNLGSKKFRWDSMSVAETNPGSAGKQGLTDLDLNEILSILSRYQFKMRDCYEKALLTDARFRGHTELMLNLDPAAKSTQVSGKFRGDGKSKSVDQLHSCLNGTLSGVQFPKKLKSQKIKFGLFLST